MIRVIAFDLDDTLWYVGPVITRAESILADWLEKAVTGYRYEPVSYTHLTLPTILRV